MVVHRATKEEEEEKEETNEQELHDARRGIRLRRSSLQLRTTYMRRRQFDLCACEHVNDLELLRTADTHTRPKAYGLKGGKPPDTRTQRLIQCQQNQL